MRKFISIAIFISFSICSYAQLLYKISGNGLKQSSYVVGTFHLAPVTFVDSIAGIHQAINAVDQVCGEVDASLMRNPEGMSKMQAAAFLPDGKTIDQVLTADQTKRLNAFLTTYIGVDLSNPMVKQQLGRLTPAMLTTQFTVVLYTTKHPGFNPQESFDEYFQKVAKEQEKSVDGLETVEFQMDLLFKKTPLPRQITQLMCLVDNTDFYEEMSDEMAKAYFAQDLNGLKAVIDKKLHNACDMTPEERADLIDNRNRAWIEKIPTIMQAKSTLFTVGAGHLVGDNGLLKLLQDKGYTVEAVKN